VSKRGHQAITFASLYASARAAFWNSTVWYAVVRFNSYLAWFKAAGTDVVAWNSSNYTPYAREARNLSPIYSRKWISRNTLHRQSLNLQAC